MHAFPMRRREQGLGTLGLFGATAGALNADDLNLAKALAHVATIAILPQNATTTGSALMPRLQAAVDQPRCSGNGQGVLAEVHGLDMNSAFARLRRYARQHDQHLSDVPASLSPVDPSPAAPCSPTSAPRRCPRRAHRRAEQLGGPPAGRRASSRPRRDPVGWSVLGPSQSGPEPLPDRLCGAFLRAGHDR